VAKDYPKMEWLSFVNPRFQTPIRSLLFNGIWASALILWGNFEQLLFFTAFAIWFFFILVGASVIIFRKRAKEKASFETWGYPFVPILFSLLCLWLFLTTISYAPQESLLGLGVMLLGVPLYYILRR